MWHTVLTSLGGSLGFTGFLVVALAISGGLLWLSWNEIENITVEMQQSNERYTEINRQLEQANRTVMAKNEEYKSIAEQAFKLQKSRDEYKQALESVRKQRAKLADENQTIRAFVDQRVPDDIVRLCCAARESSGIDIH